MRIPVRIVAALTLTLLLAACAPQAPARTGTLREASVVSVVDGDTIDVRFADGTEERVRLYGVDAPETSPGATEPYGLEAAAYVRRELAGGTVWIDTGDEERRDDTSGHRLLAWVWLSEPADGSEAEVRGKMLDARLLEAGLADVYRDVQDRTYLDLLYRLESEAKAARRGKWGAAPPR